MRAITYIEKKDKELTRTDRKPPKFKAFGGLGAHGEVVRSGYWHKSKYYKRTATTFVSAGEEVEVTDEILHNMYYYRQNLEEYLKQTGRSREKIEAELSRIDEFINKYSKK